MKIKVGLHGRWRQHKARDARAPSNVLKRRAYRELVVRNADDDI